MIMQKQSAGNFRTSIGGQALIEGILMRGPEKQSVVVRTPDGLVTKTTELTLIKDKHPIAGVPFIRGTINFLDSMIKGVSALTFSAEAQPDGDEEAGKFDIWLEEKFGNEKAQKIVIGIAVFLGICLSVGLFMLLPTLIAGLFDGVVTNSVLRNLLEGGIRITIFLIYLWAATRMREVERVFSYHGAEHKAIHCYEKGLPLTVENVRVQPRQHPRCGTSFLFAVMIVSILVFSVVQWSHPLVRVALRIALLPVVTGISYEINRLVGRYDNALTRVLAAPGKAMQNLTTNEPDDQMIEVAIEALKQVIPERSGADAW